MVKERNLWLDLDNSQDHVTATVENTPNKTKETLIDSQGRKKGEGKARFDRERKV